MDYIVGGVVCRVVDCGFDVLAANECERGDRSWFDTLTANGEGGSPGMENGDSSGTEKGAHHERGGSGEIASSARSAASSQ